MEPILTKKIVKTVAYALLFIFLTILYTLITLRLSAFWFVFPVGEIKCSSDPAAIFLKLAFLETPLVIATSLALFAWLYVKSRKKMYLYLHLPITLLVGLAYMTTKMTHLGMKTL